MQDVLKWVKEDLHQRANMMIGDDMKTLAAFAQGRDTIIEIGAFQGTLTAMFCAAARKVVTIDWFKGEEATGLWKHDDALFQSLCDWNREHLDSGKLTVHRMRSEEAVPLVRDAGIVADMIYIDADHTYEGCKADIDNYLPFLRDGGLICGHDFGGFEGVTQAVMERFPEATYWPSLLWAWTANQTHLPDFYQISGARKHTVEMVQVAYPNER